MTLGGVEHAIRPGSVSLVPPGTPVRYRYRGRSEHLYVQLRLGAAGEPREMVAVQHAGVQVATVDRQLRQALAAWPNLPGRAVAEVWAALWRVAELGALPRPAADGVRGRWHTRGGLHARIPAGRRRVCPERAADGTLRWP
ncbi:hypothetical protein [Streptomyces sp. NPDC059262]|uniref:hypothetical protein n=1 Tax=Streptomyces sp. NPDC059262 TaxID=3346797 RepID=UPI0036ABB7B5